MNEFNVTTIARRYRRISLSLIAGITLLFLMLSNVLGYLNVTNAIVVSAFFSLFFSFAYLGVWKYFATKEPQVATMFYLVGMGIRFLLSIFVVLIVCLLIKERENLLSFVIIFSIYYLVMMIFETTYFVIIEQKRIK